MRLNPLLVAVAVLYGAAGLALTFASPEILVLLGGESGAISTWAGQIAGAGLMAVGLLNWLQRYAVVGGILGRPVLLMNLIFAMAGAGASVSAWRAAGCTAALVVAGVLGVVAVAFGLRLFRPAPSTHVGPHA
jgi:hypothetical protein